MRRLVLAALAAVMLAAAAAAATLGAPAAPAREAATHTVVLHGLRFHPGTLTIRRGDSVRWLWRDEVEHNVTFHGMHSRTQLNGSYTVRFTRRGTFSYRCTIHAEQGMTGRIVVR